MIRRACTLGIAAAASLILAHSALGQGLFSVDRPEGELLLGYDGQRSFGRGVPAFTNQALRESLLLRVRGSIYSPRLLSFDVNFRPALSQLAWRSGDVRQSGSRNALFGSGGIRVLSGAPASMFVQAYRTRDNFSGIFGTRAEAENSGFTVGGDLRTPYMTFTGQFQMAEADVLTTAGLDRGMRRRQKSERAVLYAQSSKTRITLERFELDDLLRPQDIKWYRALLNNRQRWGKGSALITNFQYWDRRNQFFPSTSIVFSQAAVLRHTLDVSTNLQWSVADSKTPFDRNRIYTAAISERVQASRTLSFGVSGRGDWRNFNRGSMRNYLVDINAGGNAQLPFGTLLQASGAAGYRWRSQQVGSGGVGTALGEPHEITESRRFLLDQFQPDPTSVRATNEDGTILYEDGLDYRLVPSGPYLEFVALPGGRIQAGDVVLVDYRYNLLPSASAEFFQVLYSLDLTFRSFRAYHRNTLNLPTESDPVIVFFETQIMTTGLQFQTPTQFGQLDAGAEWVRNRFDPITTDIFSVFGGFGYRFGPRVNGSLRANWSTRRNETRYDIFQGRAALEWFAMPGLRVTGQLSAYDWSQQLGRGLKPIHGRFIGGGLGAEFRIGLMRLEGRYDHLMWSNSSSSGQNRLYFRFSRVF
jgi:hypothetical protein